MYTRRREESKTLKWFTIILVIVVIYFTYSSWSQNQSPIITPNPVDKEYTVGALLPLTGKAQILGKGSLAAMQLAVKDFNKTLKDLGSAKKLRLEVADTETSGEKALEKLKSLKQQDVSLVIGPQTFPETLAVKDFADKNKMFLLSYAGSRELTNRNDSIYSFVPGVSQQITAILAYLQQKRKIKAIIPVWDNSTWSSLIMDNLRTMAGEKKISLDQGIEITEKFNVNKTVAAISVRVGVQSRYYGRNRVAVIMLNKHIPEIFIQADKYPLLSHIKWVGTLPAALDNNLAVNTAAAAFAVKTNYTAPILGLENTSRVQNLAARIKEKTNTAADPYFLTAYDMLWVAGKTLKLAEDSNDYKQLETAFWETVNTFSGVTGPTLMDTSGDKAVWMFDFWGLTPVENGYHWLKKDSFIHTASGQEIIR